MKQLLLLFAIVLICTPSESISQVTESLYAVDPKAVEIDNPVTVYKLTQNAWRLTDFYRIENGDTIANQKRNLVMKFNEDFSLELGDRFHPEKLDCSGIWSLAANDRIRMRVSIKEEDNSRWGCTEKHFQRFFPEYHSHFVIYSLTPTKLVLARIARTDGLSGRLYYFEKY